MFSPSSCAQFDPSRPLYLHLECDHWQADQLDLMEPFGFVRFRVLPPGKQYYFFSQGIDAASSLNLNLMRSRRRRVHENTVTPSTWPSESVRVS